MSGGTPICKNPKIESEFPTAVAPSPPWIELPADVTAYILQRLEVVEIFESAENVCTTWRRVCSDPSMWRALHIERADFEIEEIRNLWRCVVDRSQGQLLHLSIEDFCDRHLLNYTVDRSSGIKRLTLEFCNGFTVKVLVEAFNKLPHFTLLNIHFYLFYITGDHFLIISNYLSLQFVILASFETGYKFMSSQSIWGLFLCFDFPFLIFPKVVLYCLNRSSGLKHVTLEGCHGIIGKTVVEAVTKLPHLEELHLIKSPEIEASDIVKIGNACPLLKSFTFTRYLDRNECALAIAKNMPNLCHLCLISNSITNEGLEAILDGCPKLESLDLSHCCKLDLEGALRKRCSEQIKHVEFPVVQTACRPSLVQLLWEGVRMTDRLGAFDP